MKNKLLVIYTVLLVLLVLLPPPITTAAGINQIVGVAVAKSRTTWNNLKDAVVGDGLSSGVGAFQLYGYNGSTFDRMRGDTTNGLYVNVTKTAANGGTAFYAIKKADLAAVSTNFPFGFTSKIVIVEAPATNTADVVIDWLGETAVAPAANTAGDDLLPPGRTITLDNYEGTSISAIAVSGTQTLYVRAFY